MRSLEINLISQPPIPGYPGITTYVDPTYYLGPKYVRIVLGGKDASACPRRCANTIIPQEGLCELIRPKQLFSFSFVCLRVPAFLFLTGWFAQSDQSRPTLRRDNKPKQSRRESHRFVFFPPCFFLYLFALELYCSVVWSPLGRASISTSYGIFFRDLDVRPLTQFSTMTTFPTPTLLSLFSQQP